MYFKRKLIDTTKKTKTIHYIPVLWGKINCRLGKVKFNSLGILLNYGSISFIIIGIYEHKFLKKDTNQVCWITQGCDFNNNCTSKVGTLLPNIDARKSVMWDFHVDDLQGTHRYNAILGNNILSKLNIDLWLFDNTIT